MKAFGAKHKNEIIRAHSRSGGVFVAITDVILERDGVVYGCKMLNPEVAVHGKAVTKEERDEFCGSKYIQSDLQYNGQHVFADVECELKKDRWAAFSGTPCQVNALYHYLVVKKIDIRKLVLIDIACHGVPSPKVWHDYVSMIEEKYRSKVISVDFRNKAVFGWAAHWETFDLGNSLIHSKLFRELFYRHYILRPSCYACLCKKLPYVSDFTLADFWGADKICKGFDDNKGVSLVFVNSRKGQELLDEIRDKLLLFECEVDKVI